MSYSFTNWGPIEPPFVGVFYGKESFFKLGEIQTVKKEFGGFDQHDVRVDDSKESEAKVRDLLASDNPFFQQKQLIILRDADTLRDESLVESYCEDPSPEKIVLLFSRHKGRVKKWLRTLNADQVKETKTVKSYKVDDWLVDYASKREYKLKKKYAEVIVKNVGDSLHALSNELEKMMVFHDGDGQLTQEDIQSVLFQHSEMSQFDIIEAWSRGNVKKALNLLTVHYEQTSNDPTLKIVGSFFHHIENLLYIKSALNSHESKDSIRSHVGKPPFIMRKLYDQCDNWRVSELNEVYSTLCDIDAGVKRGSPGRLLLERFITSDFKHKV